MKNRDVAGNAESSKNTGRDRNAESYADIINLPHHVSKTRPRMSTPNRAAQFSPFAALTGFEAAIKETARLTKERIVPDENMAAELDMKLLKLSEVITTQPKICITYFKEDERKDGGAYVTKEGALKKIDYYKHALIFADGTWIAVRDILRIELDSEGEGSGEDL